MCARGEDGKQGDHRRIVRELYEGILLRKIYGETVLLLPEG